MSVSQSPTFCPAPWTSLNINQIGLVLPCMHSGYELGNVKQKNIFEIINDQPLQSLKQAQACGKWHEACKECQNRENYGEESPRKRWHVEPSVIAAIDADPDKFFRPEHLTLNWSNLCNLACTYCNEETSTAWQGYKKIPISYIRNEHQALIELVGQNRQTLKGLTLGGGEPLLQKGLVNLLNQIDPTNVSVVVTTNLSVDINLNEIYQTLKTWPNVTWMISFDSVEADKFEYVRHGADWNLFCKNIDQMLADNLKNVLAHPAYSIYCALDLNSYYEWCNQRSLDIFWCDLVHPYALDVRQRNKEIRDAAIAQIDLVTEKYGPKDPTGPQGGYGTLQRYRQQLVDNSYLDAQPWAFDEADLKKFCVDIESRLGKTKTFAELWPHIWSLL